MVDGCNIEKNSFLFFWGGGNIRRLIVTLFGLLENYFSLVYSDKIFRSSETLKLLFHRTVPKNHSGYSFLNFHFFSNANDRSVRPLTELLKGVLYLLGLSFFKTT